MSLAAKRVKLARLSIFMDSLDCLSDAWKTIVEKAVEQAIDGDYRARSWLSDILRYEIDIAKLAGGDDELDLNPETIRAEIREAAIAASIVETTEPSIVVEATADSDLQTMCE